MYQAPFVPQGPHVLARPVNPACLVDYLAALGFLRRPVDRHFLFVATEMARVGNIPLDQLLTDASHHVAELRWVCYHVLFQQGANWPTIATLFSKSRDSVRTGARRVATALKAPKTHASLVAYHHELLQSFTTYLTVQSNGH